MTQYIVVPAPGYYGDETRIVSTHRTEAAARKAIRGKHRAIYADDGHSKAGDRWLRVYEQAHERVA